MSDAKLSIGPARFLRTLLIGIAITVGLILAVGAAQGRGPAAVLAGFLHLEGACMRQIWACWPPRPSRSRSTSRPSPSPWRSGSS